jgi:diguanylate cyclase (GGDEF)-like protein
MNAERWAKAAELLRRDHDVDIVSDILLGHSGRVWLFAGEPDRMGGTMVVLAGSLALFGLPDADTVRMDALFDLFTTDCIYAEVSGAEEYRRFVRRRLSREDDRCDVTFPILSQGVKRWVNVQIAPIEGRPGLRSVCLTDMTAVMDVETMNFAKSHRDSLTGLFNKYTLDYHYGERYRRPDFHALYLDLDDFKTVNDRIGHVGGDAVLSAFAAILRGHEREYDRFYRIGGDEFVGLFFRSEEEIRKLAADIVAATRNIPVPPGAKRPTVSVGIVRATKREDVIAKADQVMYHVKRSGKDNFLYTVE